MIQTLTEAEITEWILQAERISAATIVHAVSGVTGDMLYTSEQAYATRTGHAVVNMNSGDLFTP